MSAKLTENLEDLRTTLDSIMQKYRDKYSVKYHVELTKKCQSTDRAKWQQLQYIDTCAREVQNYIEEYLDDDCTKTIT